MHECVLIWFFFFWSFYFQLYNNSRQPQSLMNATILIASSVNCIAMPCINLTFFFKGAMTNNIIIITATFIIAHAVTAGVPLNWPTYNNHNSDTYGPTSLPESRQQSLHLLHCSLLYNYYCVTLAVFIIIINNCTLLSWLLPLHLNNNNSTDQRNILYILI